jgi:hypothetical protein
MDREGTMRPDYRALLRAIVQDYAAQPTDAGGEGIEDYAICDDASGNYLWFASGWQGYERIYGPAVHLRIKGDQIIIETNFSEADLRDRLITGGVPEEAIVVGWVQPGT